MREAIEKLYAEIERSKRNAERYEKRAAQCTPNSNMQKDLLAVAKYCKGMIKGYENAIDILEG